MRQLRVLLADGGSPVWALASHPAGDLLVSGDSDGMRRLRDTTTWTERHALRAHTAAVGALAFAPGGAQLVSSDADGVVRVRDTATWAERHALTGHGRTVGAVAVAADGALMATGGVDGTARTWQVPGRANGPAQGFHDQDAVDQSSLDQ